MKIRAVCGRCSRTVEREIAEGRPYPTVLLCECGNRLSLRADPTPRRRWGNSATEDGERPRNRRGSMKAKLSF